MPSKSITLQFLVCALGMFSSEPSFGQDNPSASPDALFKGQETIVFYRSKNLEDQFIGFFLSDAIDSARNFKTCNGLLKSVSLKDVEIVNEQVSCGGLQSPYVALSAKGYFTRTISASVQYLEEGEIGTVSTVLVADDGTLQGLIISDPAQNASLIKADQFQSFLVNGEMKVVFGDQSQKPVPLRNWTASLSDPLARVEVETLLGVDGIEDLGALVDKGDTPNVYFPVNDVGRY